MSAYLAKGPNPQIFAEDELSYLDGWLFHTADGGVRKECGVGDEKDRMVKRRGKHNKSKRRRRREREAASRAVSIEGNQRPIFPTTHCDGVVRRVVWTEGDGEFVVRSVGKCTVARETRLSVTAATDEERSRSLFTVRRSPVVSDDPSTLRTLTSILMLLERTIRVQTYILSQSARWQTFEYHSIGGVSGWKKGTFFSVVLWLQRWVTCHVPRVVLLKVRRTERPLVLRFIKSPLRLWL